MKYQVTRPAMMLKTSIATAIWTQKRNQLIVRRGPDRGAAAAPSVDFLFVLLMAAVAFGAAAVAPDAPVGTCRPCLIWLNARRLVGNWTRHFTVGRFVSPAALQ